MKLDRWRAVLLLFLAALPALAQNDEASQEKQRRQLVLADSVIADARELVLPENRATVLASTAARVWETDRKRGQELFDEAVMQLIAAQVDAEADRRKNRPVNYLDQNIRPQVLRTIAAKNADLALKSLYKTRPAAVERAIANAGARDGKIRGPGGDESYLVQNELSLEQSLVKLVAEQSPERAVELLRQSIKKGVTGESLGLLRKLHEIDPAAAVQMGSEIVNALLKKNFVNGTQVDFNALQVSVSLLNDHIRDRPATDRSFRFVPAEMRSLADKVINFLLSPDSRSVYYYSSQIAQVAAKMRPDAVEKLKDLERNQVNGFSIRPLNPDMTRLLNSDTPLEQVIAEAPKLPADARRGVYHQAANRLAASGDIARARQLLEENFAGEALTNARESLSWFQAHQLINQGKFTEAEALIEEFPEGNRFSALISLADAVFSKNQSENKGQALNIIAKALSSLPTRPENNNEMQQIMQIVGAYSRIDPPEAFRLLDSLVPQINELAEASAVVYGFTGNGNIRRGEFLIISGVQIAPQVDGSLIRGLAAKDFDRTLSLINAFSRREMRISFKQQLLESL